MIKTCVVCEKEFNALGSANCCSAECICIRSRVQARGHSKKWAKAHPERVGKWNAENPEKRLAANRAWATEHPERVREQRYRWKTSHRKMVAEQGRRYRAAHPDLIREQKRKQYAAHTGGARVRARRFLSTERGKAGALASRHNRRVRLSGIPMTVDTVLEVKTEYGGICPYCNMVIGKGHVDHIVPVSKEDTNERENLVWVCQRCNEQKGSMSLLPFLLFRMSAR